MTWLNASAPRLSRVTDADRIADAAGYFSAALWFGRAGSPYCARSALCSAWNRAALIADPDARARASHLRNSISSLIA